jgi:hypothetical protein
MPKYYVIENNEIVNFINAETLEDAELLTKTNCLLQDDTNIGLSVGHKYDGSEWYDPKHRES